MRHKMEKVTFGALTCESCSYYVSMIRKPGKKCLFGYEKHSIAPCKHHSEDILPQNRLMMRELVVQ
jgi:hypothetical protein